jgi:hypothetical protein
VCERYCATCRGIEFGLGVRLNLKLNCVRARYCVTCRGVDWHCHAWLTREGVGKLATRLEVLAAGERSASVPIYRFIWQLASSLAEICTEVVKHVLGHAQILTMPHLSSHATSLKMIFPLPCFHFAPHLDIVGCPDLPQSCNLNLTTLIFKRFSVIICVLYTMLSFQIRRALLF